MAGEMDVLVGHTSKRHVKLPKLNVIGLGEANGGRDSRTNVSLEHETDTDIVLGRQISRSGMDINGNLLRGNCMNVLLEKDYYFLHNLVRTQHCNNFSCWNSILVPKSPYMWENHTRIILCITVSFI